MPLENTPIVDFLISCESNNNMAGTRNCMAFPALVPLGFKSWKPLEDFVAVVNVTFLENLE
jgi:hypothetical protein